MTVRRRRILPVVLLALLGLSGVRCVHAQAPSDMPGGGTDYSSSSRPAAFGDSADSPAESSDSARSAASVPGSAVVATPEAPKPQTGIDWRRLGASSLTFLSIQNAFRCATEEGTREAFSNPFWPGYVNAVGSLHGWSDGDPFLVNYVGHPMQGAVTGFMWQHNDRAYRDAVFGKNTRYWKARLRGMGFAYLYSVQFEIGLMSEASIGQIQALYPAYGFVDHVVTPTIGTGWAIAEDVIDKYVIRGIESHVANPWVRLASRIALNPSRSMSNVMNYERPQHRDDRPGVFQPYPESAAMKKHAGAGHRQDPGESPSRRGAF